MVKDKWWKAAVELKIGDVLETSDGKEETVKSIKVEEKGYPITTYNLTVEDNHTFFVGSEKVLTHNTVKLLNECNYMKEINESITERVSKADFTEKLRGENITLKGVKTQEIAYVKRNTNEPYHKVITNYQNSFAKQLTVGEIKTIEWPMSEWSIYPIKR